MSLSQTKVVFSPHQSFNIRRISTTPASHQANPELVNDHERQQTFVSIVETTPDSQRERPQRQKRIPAQYNSVFLICKIFVFK